jgi:hypothetical protein
VEGAFGREAKVRDGEWCVVEEENRCGNEEGVERGCYVEEEEGNEARKSEWWKGEETNGRGLR